MTIVVDTASGVPPYEQVRAQLADQVASGALPVGTRLATVRQLAADLGLAAGTVARAYRELESDGVVATQGRRGTFVRGTEADPTTGPGLGDLVARFVEEARGRGLTRQDAIRLVDHHWPPAHP